MTQMALGMMGMFIVHPRRPLGPRVDRDFVFMTHEWKLRPGTRRPDPNEMTDFNVLTFNSRVFPGTEPLVIKKGERVRIRFGNLSAISRRSASRRRWPSWRACAKTGSTQRRASRRARDEPHGAPAGNTTRDERSRPA